MLPQPNVIEREIERPRAATMTATVVMMMKVALLWAVVEGDGLVEVHDRWTLPSPDLWPLWALGSSSGGGGRGG